MERPNIDLTKYDETIVILQKILDHRKARPTTKSDELYYEALLDHFRTVRETSEAGQPLVAHGVGIPIQVLIAMGVPNMQFDYIISATMSAILGIHTDFYQACSRIGVRDEICSANRMPLGAFAKGWLPRPSLVAWTSVSQCDNMSKSAQLMAALYNVPGYFIDRPYQWNTKKGIDFMVREMENFIHYLEETLDRKMDWGKLKETISITVKQNEVIEEIHKLLATKPCPMTAGEASKSSYMRWMCEGTETSLNYYEILLQEMKERVAQGKGAVKEEKFRIISLNTPPGRQRELFDWMEEERGAVLVAEPYLFQFGNMEVDPEKPLEALGALYYNEPYYRFYGPLSEALDMIVEDALASHVDAGIDWFNSKCRFGPSAARSIKETMEEKVGVPVLVTDADILDFSTSTMERTKRFIEEFIDMLEAQKKSRAKR